MYYCQLLFLDNTAIPGIGLSFISFCGSVDYLHWKSLSAKLFYRQDTLPGLGPAGS